YCFGIHHDQKAGQIDRPRLSSSSIQMITSNFTLQALIVVLGVLAWRRYKDIWPRLFLTSGIVGIVSITWEYFGANHLINSATHVLWLLSFGLLVLITVRS